MTSEQTLIQILSKYDTPTICNAIEVAQGRRGFKAFTKCTVQHAPDNVKPMVGFARTAKIAGNQATGESQALVRSRRLDYFRHMAGGPRPAVTVIEDTDYPNCTAAWWGEVHSAVHKGLGIEGALTNGVMRDLDDLEPGFQIIAGSVGPSHAFCHVTEIGTPVNIFDLYVVDGDLLHADQHGAVVIPPDVIKTLPKAIEKLLASERIVLDVARRPDFDMQKLEIAWTAFEKART